MLAANMQDDVQTAPQDWLLTSQDISKHSLILVIITTRLSNSQYNSKQIYGVN